MLNYEQKVNILYGNYTFENCRFIEFAENRLRGILSGQKPILQYDLNGKFIKEWESITKASLFVSGDVSNLRKCALNLRQSAYGFIWKFK